MENMYVNLVSNSDGSGNYIGVGNAGLKIAAAGSGDVPTMDEIFEPEPLTKGTAGHDPQGHLNEEEVQETKGTAGNDAQGRLTVEEVQKKKFSEGGDAQNKGQPPAKGTAGQDAQSRRN